MADTGPLDYLVQHGIKPSIQRMAVMEYLLTHRTHPTVDEIYNALIGRIPTLSKTTVYNTLRLFVEQGAAMQLTIDERKVCFDGHNAPHAHFLCNRCARVFDLPLRQADLRAAAELPGDFLVETCALYYRGVCGECYRRETETTTT